MPRSLVAATKTNDFSFIFNVHVVPISTGRTTLLGGWWFGFFFLVFRFPSLSEYLETKKMAWQWGRQLLARQAEGQNMPSSPHGVVYLAPSEGCRSTGQVKEAQAWGWSYLIFLAFFQARVGSRKSLTSSQTNAEKEKEREREREREKKRHWNEVQVEGGVEWPTVAREEADGGGGGGDDGDGKGRGR